MAFEEFLTIIQINLNEIKLDLSYNLLEDVILDVLEICIFQASSITLTFLDVSYNKFSNEGFWKLNQAYNSSKNKSKFKLVQYPFPIHENYLKTVFLERKTNLTVNLEKITCFNKKKSPPYKKEWINQIKNKVREIRNLRGFSLTVEKIGNLCSEIYKLEYDYPNKKLGELKDIVWDLLNKAIEIQV